MSVIKCSGCGATFTGDDNFESPYFDDHDCPAVDHEEIERMVAEARAADPDKRPFEVKRGQHIHELLEDGFYKYWDGSPKPLSEDMLAAVEMWKLHPVAEVTSGPANTQVLAFYPNAGVDRERAMGWAVRRKDVADRLAVAIEAGVILTNPTIETDVNGNTYVSAASQVRGRAMNADLKSLGY